MAQITKPDETMDIIPHYPIERYTVEGFPLSSLEAFILYANGAEIYSLITENKTISGAINELKKYIDKCATKEELENYATLEDLEDYATKEEVNQVQSQVNALTVTVQQHETKINTLTDNVNKLLEQVPADPLTVSLVSNTNPRYFSTTVSPVKSTFHNITITQEGDFIQNTDNSDGILEILNITFVDNSVLCDNEGNEVSSTNTPHFYIPMSVDYYNQSNEYINSDIFMLDCTWTREMGAYDLSIYFRGVVEIPNGGKAHYKFSAYVPTNLKKKEDTPDETN